ncbi:MAG: DUF6884 domain-containing protein [Bacillaceae bacterium]
MKRLCIIPCGAKKIWDIHPELGPIQAKDVYKSTFHHFCQEYANTFFSDWVILSAKHGFLFPEDYVAENYNLSFDHKSEEIIRIEQLKKQINNRKLNEFDEIILLAGKKHKKIVTQLFEEDKLVYPLHDCKGIGYMNQKLKKAIEARKEIL